jgi:hypothetical protein
MKNIHLLPTDRSSRVSIKNDVLVLHRQQYRLGTQNIYITSDEEIKEGDWCICEYSDGDISVNKFEDSSGINKYKIILTTDPDLIKDGVQAIDDEFLEWFVKNPSCEEVEIEKIKFRRNSLTHSVIELKKDDVITGAMFRDGIYDDYKIIIPKGEPKQEYCDNCNNDICCCIIKTQETLEEFVFKVPFNYNIKPKEVIDMCMKEQENIILTWRLGYFIDMINSLPDDTEKNRILKSVFNNRQGELLLESYKSMKSHYEE